jgi:ureidoglycolate hydrolase
MTLVTQGRQLLNGRRVWHPARVVLMLLTRFVSVVYTGAVSKAETAFARSYIS